MFNNKITLIKNSRGCWIIDTIKGCPLSINGGCFGDCYDNRIASRYGIDFKTPIRRDFKNSCEQLYFDGFENQTHQNEIIKQIISIDMPFVRIGEMGDPSIDWDHTLKIISAIKIAGKKIVIITKHINKMSQNHFNLLKNIDACINTSVSAIDDFYLLESRLEQFEKLKDYCNSVLRIVSFDFNTENEKGKQLKKVQDSLFSFGGNKVINTVFRPTKRNYLINDGIIKVEMRKFLGSRMLISDFNHDTFIGYCNDCNEMCGINL